MSRPASSAMPVLLVEPELSAQIDGLDAVRAAHARVDLACVATCGGALLALDSSEFQCLLLSTYICLYPEERLDLLALVRRARALGVAVVAFGPGDADLLGVPVHASLSYREVAWGKMNTTLDGARASAELERRFASGITGVDRGVRSKSS